MTSIKGVLGLLIPILLATCYILPVQAFEVASTYTLNDNQAVSGDIISNTPGKGFVRSNVTYDNHIFGVLSDNPLIVNRPTDPNSKERPILQTGDLDVNVTDFNGKISKGDYISSSPIPGKGMKATLSGYVIGVAISDMTSGDNTSFQGRQLSNGVVKVSLRIEYAELSTPRSSSSFFSALNAAFFRSVQNPEQFTLVIRYIIAGIIVILSLLIGFFAFTQSISKGIEAMGRNPLARRSIQISIIIQVIMTILTTIGSIVLALIIVRV